MDDQGKRLLLALVISFAFLFFYQSYFVPPAPPPAEEPAKETAAPETSEEPPALPVLETLPTAEPVEAIEAVSERVITIETPLYRARLSNRGGVIKSFTLVRYREELERPESHVEMVHALEGERLLPLAAEFTAAGGPLGFSQALFQAEGEDLNLKKGQEGRVVFRYRTAEGLEMVKTLTFGADTYEIFCSVKLLNRSSQPLGGRAAILWAPGLEPSAGGGGGSSLLSGGRYGYQGAIYLEGSKAEKIKSKKLESPLSIEGPITWVASEDMYFVAALLPSDENMGALARKGTGDRVEIGLFSQLRIPPASAATLNATAYVGPKEMSSLRAVDPSLTKTIDLGMFEIIAKPLLDLLNFFHKYLGNYGLSIIILSALIKIVFIPFSAISHRSMKKMSKLQPQINALRDKFKKDREKLNQEIMKLYQENKVNPASGCLPILVQIPVFFALYRALLGAIELRHAPFYFWIADLSAKDPLYITPIFMGATMVLQQKMTPTTGDPRQARLMMFMPVVFTALFLSFPSGLVIYWTVNNILTIGHQYWMNKTTREAEPVEAEAPSKGKGKGKKKK